MCRDTRRTRQSGEHAAAGEQDVEPARKQLADKLKQAVEKLFNVKVEEVRTANFEGKMRRRGRFAGYRSDWKKAYVKLEDGQKVPEFTEM